RNFPDDAPRKTDGARGRLLARRVRAGELDLRRGRAQRHPAGIRRRHAVAAHDALWLLPAAAAPQRRRPRGSPAQARARPGAAQAAARLPRAGRRGRARAALFPARIHARERSSHNVAGDEATAAAGADPDSMTPLRRLLGYFARHKPSLTAGFLCVLGSAVFSLMKPLIIGNAVNELS